MLGWKRGRDWTEEERARYEWWQRGGAGENPVSEFSRDVLLRDIRPMDEEWMRPAAVELVDRIEVVGLPRGLDGVMPRFRWLYRPSAASSLWYLAERQPMKKFDRWVSVGGLSSYCPFEMPLIAWDRSLHCRESGGWVRYDR